MLFKLGLRASHVMTLTNSEFVGKLFRMLEEPENYPYIGWSRDGRSFIITNQEGFSEFVLEKHFRHKNWSSFVRQLNKYDFCKVKSDGGRDGYEVLSWEYMNRYFQRGRPDLLCKIRRKKAPSEKGSASADPHLRRIESNVVYQAHVLNAVKEISKYLQAVTEDINEIKKYIYQERRKICDSGISVLFIVEGSIDLSHLYNTLRLHNCLLTIVASEESVNDGSHGQQDLIVLYATSSRCSAIIRNIRSADMSIPIALMVDEGFRSKYVSTLGIGATDVLMMPLNENELVRLLDKYKTPKT